MVSELSIRRIAASLASVGLFVWILVLFFVPGTTNGDVPVVDDSGYASEDDADIACAAISVIADGKEADDWPLDDDGEKSTSTIDAVNKAGELCDRFRDARSSQMTLLAVPVVVLGVFALWGPNRRTDEDAPAVPAVPTSSE